MTSAAAEVLLFQPPTGVVPSSQFNSQVWRGREVSCCTRTYRVLDDHRFCLTVTALVIMGLAFFTGVFGLLTCAASEKEGLPCPEGAFLPLKILAGSGGGLLFITSLYLLVKCLCFNQGRVRTYPSGHASFDGAYHAVGDN